MKLIDRYIIKELIPPFLFGILLFNLLFIASSLIYRVAKMLGSQKVPFDLVAEFVVNSIPSILVYTLPTSLLLGVIIAFGRLSSEGEITAMKAGGIGLYRIVIPVACVGLVVTIFSYYFNNFVVPVANFKAANVLIKTASYEVRSKLLENIVVPIPLQNELERIVFAKKYDASTNIMTSPELKEYYKENLIRMTKAQKAVWETRGWKFINGVTLDFNDKGEITLENKFSELEVNIPQNPAEIISLSNRRKSPEEMTPNELKKIIAKIGQTANDATIQYYQRIALSFSCLVFAFIGIPPSLQSQRSSSSLGLGLSILIAFSYFITTFIFTVFANAGWLSVVVAMWAPNVIFMGLALYLIVRAAQH